MEKKVVYTQTAPKPAGPYSQAIAYGSLVFCAGQIALDPQTNTMVAGGIESQTRQVLTNLANVLLGAGSSLDKVLKTTVFVTDLNNAPLVNSIYSEYFKDNSPARTFIQVARLPLDALIEIEAIAHI